MITLRVLYILKPEKARFVWLTNYELRLGLYYVLSGAADLFKSMLNHVLMFFGRVCVPLLFLPIM